MSIFKIDSRLKSLLFFALVGFFVVSSVLVVNYFLMAWTEPTAGPPNGYVGLNSLDAADGDPVDAVYVDNAGNVGIGATNPSVKLQVKDGFIYNTQSGATLSRLGLQNSVRTWSISAYGNDYAPNGGFVIADESGPGARMTINTAGNVGIGVGNATAKLDVRGEALFINPSGSGKNAVSINNDEGSYWGLFIFGNSTNGIRLGPSADDYCEDEAVGGGSACDITSDYAELMYFSEVVDNGDVVIIDTKAPGKFKKSYKPYDKLVAGVVSSNPAMVIGKEGISIKGWEAETNGARPLAVAGKKRIKVSDENGAIQPGDLLVTSSEPGKAMRCDQDEYFKKCAGAILGKAMTSVGDDGKVLTLISLQ